MPFRSENQRKAMYAAANGHSNIGIPENAAKKFISHSDSLDSEWINKVMLMELSKRFDESGTEPIAPKAGTKGRAAGILFLTKEGQTLLLRRGNGGDFPQTFGVPGGHQEEGETLEDSARREAFEETGIKYEGELTKIHDDGQFATFLAKIDDKFDVAVCDESTGYVWTDLNNPPQPLHPGLINTFRIVNVKTELDAARLVMDGILPSPTPYANMHLLAIRVTGTGLAFRSSIGEHVWRDPSIYMNEEFLQRCNGLQVILDHPKDAVLDSKEFNSRTIGSVFIPYFKDQDEVWAIAKIYDDEAMKEISEGDISTSPSVVFNQDAGNVTLKTEDGEPILVEGVPFLLDHIAIVTKARGSVGVWDKGGDPQGVLLTNNEVSTMSDATMVKADAQADKLDMILGLVQTVAKGQESLTIRMDSMEKNMPADPIESAADKKRKDEDKARKDDDEEKRKDEDSEEKKRKDEELKRKDDDEEAMADKKRKDASGSNEGEEHGKGDIKPDEDARKDEEAKKADDDAEKFADVQAKADSVYSSFGKSASRALQGESLIAYRKRILRGLQSYSDSYKDINLSKEIVGEKMLELAEKQIFADAISKSREPMTFAADSLVAVKSQEGGREVTRYRGDINVWLDSFRAPTQVGRLQNPKHAH